MDLVIRLEKDGEYYEAHCDSVKGSPFSGRNEEEAVRNIAQVALLQLALEVGEGRHSVIEGMHVRLVVSF